MTDLGPTSTALELAAALRRRELSSTELLDACLEEVDRLNPELNAVIWRNDDEGRAAAAEADRALAGGAEGQPFLGVPMPIKDLTPVAGWPVTYGSNGAPEGPSAESEMVVDAFRAAGFVLTARTNTPEFGPITVAENSRYGISRNPWDPDHTPGGSSGGAGSATAAGMFPIAHANDGGGSIRIPASCCGLVGLKTSRGRVPRLAQSWLGAVVEGVVSRDVADSAAVLDAIAGPDPHAWFNAPVPERPFAEEVGADPGKLRIGIQTASPFGLPVDEDCVVAAQDAAKALEELGHSVETIELPVDPQQLIENFVVLANAGLADYAGVDWSKTEPHVRSQHAQGEATSSLRFAEAARTLELLSRQIVSLWDDLDLVISPTLSIVPPVAGTVLEMVHANPDEPATPVVQMVTFTAAFNTTGQPAISLPLHWTDAGLPVGVQLVGKPFDEVTVIRVAGQLEQARPWRDRRPELAGAA